jgi:hypothetical protein
VDEEGSDDSHNILAGNPENALQLRDVYGGVYLRSRSREEGFPPPKQIPRGIAHFVNRADILRALDAAVESGRVNSHAGSGPTIYAIAGTGGIGKTAVAVHW